MSLNLITAVNDVFLSSNTETIGKTFNKGLSGKSNNEDV